MRLTPFAVVYGGPVLASNVILSSTKTVIAGSVASINAAIAELNTNFANYGYAATPNLPVIPAVPVVGTVSAQAIAYFQTTPPGGTQRDYGSPTSYLLVDAYSANGYNDPSTQFDALTADAVIVNLLVAQASLATAAAVAITVQPTNQSIAHNAAGAIALTATGAGAVFAWYIQLPAGGPFQLITNGTGPFTTATTASLTITNPVLATYNGAKIRGVVSAASGGQQVASNLVTLTVT